MMPRHADPTRVDAAELAESMRAFSASIVALERAAVSLDRAFEQAWRAPADASRVAP